MLSASLLVALGLWVGLRIFWGYPPAPPSLAVLTRREHAFLAAVADAIYPRGGAIEPSGTDAGVPGYLDRHLSLVPPRMRFLLRLLFFLVEHATLFFPKGGPSGLRRFSKLSQTAQVAYLEGWQTSHFFARTLVFVSLRSVITLAYLADPAVLRALNLAPKQVDTPVSEADLLWPRIGERPQQIRFTPDDLTPPADPSPLALDGPLHPDYEPRRP